jgi:hypothetical protein
MNGPFCQATVALTARLVIPQGEETRSTEGSRALVLRCAKRAITGDNLSCPVIDALAVLLYNDYTTQKRLRAWETTVFEILSEIRDIEKIAAGRSVHIRRYLERTYGPGRWRKMKGLATVQLSDGSVCEAEIHWFEAHGIGRKDFKIKRVIR